MSDNKNCRLTLKYLSTRLNCINGCPCPHTSLATRDNPREVFAHIQHRQDQQTSLRQTLKFPSRTRTVMQKYSMKARCDIEAPHPYIILRLAPFGISASSAYTPLTMCIRKT